MSYLGDIRENSIGPNGELWEGDNRIEERHYWNGAFIDLCNLSAEDYAKTIFMTNGGGSSDTPTTNSIQIQEASNILSDCTPAEAESLLYLLAETKKAIRKGIFILPSNECFCT